MGFINGSSVPFLQDSNVVYNTSCDVSVAVGQWVYVDALGIVKPAIATAYITSNVLGIVEAKPTSTTCDVRLDGLSSVVFAALDTTKDYFLSDTVPGNMTLIAPITGSGNWIVPIGRAPNALEFVVNIKIRIRRGL